MKKATKKIISNMTPWLLIIAGALILINAIMLFIVVHRPAILGVEDRFPEVAVLSAHPLDFIEIMRFFRNVAEKKGAVYAFNLMNAAPIPSGTDMHLLAHEVGNVLYEKEGAEGIRFCTEDFRNACSHTIVVGLFHDKGEAALPIIADICRHAPGGSGAYTMCFHGLGHGILAYTGYDLRRTANMCKKTGTPAYNNREYAECVGGSIMEIISGVHDAQLREKQAKKYLSNENPLSPCSSDFMDAAVRPMCYTYLTPHLFTAAGADLNNPAPEYFKKAFGFCDTIHSSPADRDACYGGFGKEFIGIVRGRDARLSTLKDIDDGKLTLIYQWCKLADSLEARHACMFAAANSLYWGGEHGEELPISFCRVIDEEFSRDKCFGNLIGALHFYKRDFYAQTEACKKFPEPYQTQCKNP